MDAAQRLYIMSFNDAELSDLLNNFRRLEKRLIDASPDNGEHEALPELRQDIDWIIKLMAERCLIDFAKAYGISGKSGD